MLNLYAVKIWHSSGPHHFETIEVRTYTERRAEDLASESYPGCMAAAQRIFDLTKYKQPGAPHFRPTLRPQ